MGLPSFTWGDLEVVLEQLGPESAYVRAVHGDEAMWGLPEHLMALAIDALNVANWQRSADGAKGRNYPKPIPRPGVGPQHIGGNDPIPIDEMDDWLGWSRELRED